MATMTGLEDIEALIAALKGQTGQEFTAQDIALLDTPLGGHRERLEAQAGALRGEGAIEPAGVFDLVSNYRRGAQQSRIRGGLEKNADQMGTLGGLEDQQGRAQEAMAGLTQARAAEQERDEERGYKAQLLTAANARTDARRAEVRGENVIDEMENDSQRQLRDIVARRQAVEDRNREEGRTDAETAAERADTENTIEQFEVQNEAGDRRWAYKNYAGDQFFANGPEKDQSLTDEWRTISNNTGTIGNTGLTSSQFDRSVERLGDKLLQFNIPATETAWEELQASLVELAPEGEEIDLPGIGYGQNIKGAVGDFLTKGAELVNYDKPGGKLFKAKAISFMNQALRSIAGLNQTLSEELRIKVGSALEGTANDEDFYAAITLIADHFAATSQTAYARSNPEVRAQFRKNMKEEGGLRQEDTALRESMRSRVQGSKVDSARTRGPQRRILRTGTDPATGEKVIMYSDGTEERR